MKSVLVIEDDRDNMKLISYALQRSHYKVFWAESGEKGLNLAFKEKPFFIIIDINLPGMNGLEVARKIRSSQTIGEIPLIALTSSALVGDRERIMQAGFNGYFEKPIDPLTIMEKIHELIKGGEK